MEAYLGTIILWPGVSFVPQNWALCNGQQLAVSQYEALYSLIGNIYGGDTTNFNLPNFTNQLVIGNPTGVAPGTKQGTPFALTPPPVTVTQGISMQLAFSAPALTAATMPAHTHTAQLSTSSLGSISVPIKIPVNSTGSANLAAPGSNVLGVAADGGGQGDIQLYNNTATSGATLAPFNTTFNISAIQGSISNSTTGVATPSAINANAPGMYINSPIMPCISMAYIICTVGLYPPFQ
ncbi:MAG: phage tail protein [Mucilaginibacter sp.]